MLLLLMFLLSSVTGSLLPLPRQPHTEPPCDTCSDEVQCDVDGSNIIEVVTRVRWAISKSN